jgi:hypothetical protein
MVTVERGRAILIAAGKKLRSPALLLRLLTCALIYTVRPRPFLFFCLECNFLDEIGGNHVVFERHSAKKKVALVKNIGNALKNTG